MQSSSGRDLVVGVFVIIGLMAIAYLSLRVGGVWYGGSETIRLTATFEDIGALRTRAPVVVSGVRVGQVREIGLAPDLRALVTVEVDAGVELSIDTEASVRTTGVLGDQFIALEPGAEDETLVDGDELAYTTSAFNLERLIGSLVHGMSVGGEE
jgi:phospholipid/cholesterol/gamma-HCH transport system substrate-binding protein